LETACPQAVGRRCRPLSPARGRAGSNAEGVPAPMPRACRLQCRGRAGSSFETLFEVYLRAGVN
jgi:hypothetical protein